MKNKRYQELFRQSVINCMKKSCSDCPMYLKGSPEDKYHCLNLAMSEEVEQMEKDQTKQILTSNTVLSILAMIAAVIVKSAFLLAAISFLYNGFPKCGVTCLVASLLIGNFSVHSESKKKEEDADESA